MMLFASVYFLCLTAFIQNASDVTDAPPPPQPPAAAEEPEASDDADVEAMTLPRVIIYPSRLRSVSGHLLEEGPKTIRLLDRQNKIHEFDPSLIYAKVYLHDVDAPVKAVIHFQDGRVREGLLEEDAFDYVQFRIHGVKHSYDREDILIVQLVPDFQDEYEHLLQQLDETDIQAHLSLCRWLLKENKLIEARAELQRLLQRENNPTAKGMLHKVEARLHVLASKTDDVSSSEDIEDDADTMPKLVSDEDVNLIRVYEIQIDNPPRLRVPAKTVQALLDEYRGSPLLPTDAQGEAAFTKSDPADIVRVMFELRARDLYGGVQVLTEPELLATFRKRIHDNWLLNKCGSRACHGGPEEGAGRFRLHWSYRPDDRIRTSNLLALTRLELDGQKMLDWSQPEQSLLYQYALPQSEATKPHPMVKGWKPIFTPGAMPVRKAYLNWVEQMMDRHHKDWPVDYEPWSPPETAAIPHASDEPEPESGQSP